MSFFHGRASTSPTTAMAFVGGAKARVSSRGASFGRKLVVFWFGLRTRASKVITHFGFIFLKQERACLDKKTPRLQSCGLEGELKNNKNKITASGYKKGVSLWHGTGWLRSHGMSCDVGWRMAAAARGGCLQNVTHRLGSD